MASPVVHALDDNTDLDDYTDEELKHEIDDEIDDVWERDDVEELDTREEVVQAFLEALSDKGDDEDESLLDLAELEEELAEAGTSIEKEVRAAVYKFFPEEPAGSPQANSALNQKLHEVGSFLSNLLFRDARKVKGE